MSNTITAPFTDPRINDIRNAIRQKTDAIPFLLLPVRTETRFMQIERQPSQGATTIETVLEGIGYFHIQVINTESNINGTTIRSLTAEANDLITAIKTMGLIAIKEKGWLKQLYGDLQKDVLIVVAASANTFVTESQQLNATVAQLFDTITATGTEDTRLLQDIRQLLNEFITIEANLEILNRSNKKKLPYTDVKNKKDLYTYVTKSLTGIKTFYTGIDDKIKAVKFIDKNQRDRFIKIQADIQEQLNLLNTSLPTVHTDGGWKNFMQQTVEPLVAAILVLAAAYQTNTLPLLNNLPLPPSGQTGNLYFSGIQALIKINKFNLSAGKGYDPIKRFKTYLQPAVTKLAKAVQSPIQESKPEQVKLLQNLFAAVNTQVNTSINKIQNYTPLNNSQTVGKGIINTYFNGDVVKVISAFAGTDVQNFPMPVFTPAVPQIVNQLWVRIFPDDIFVITHEEALTAAEVDAGKQFWNLWWTAGGDKDLEMGAWRTLCTAFGTHRASWIARSLNPNTSALAKNVAALKTHPSAKIIDATNILDATWRLAKQLPAHLPQAELFKSIRQSKDVQLITHNLNKVLGELKSIKVEQDYLLEKFKVALINMASGFNPLITKATQLNAADQQLHVNTLQQLHAGTKMFNQVQAAFSKIKSLPHKEFVKTLDTPFVFPDVPVKDKEWSQAPHANSLPDRFVVITMKGGQFSHIAVGNPVDDALQLGLDPQKFDNLSLFTIDENGNMNIDEGLQWMTDYDVAVTKGMGITLDITDAEYNEGIDKLIVLGVKNTDALTSKQLLEKLITNHIYSVDGMSFLKVGTPTNNTHLSSSGFLSDDMQQRYDIEVGNIKYDISNSQFNKHDGQFFCDATGSDNGVLQYVNDAANFEIANAYAANRALWGASLGHYMEEMMDSVFTYDNIRRTEDFFTSYCIGRGAVPSIRVGMQPYGILTTTAFSQLQLYSSIPSLTVQEAQGISPWGVDVPALDLKLQTRYEMRLFSLLNLLKDTWTNLRHSNVISTDNLYVEGQDPQQRFVQMLGLNATSLDYFYRYAINIAKGPNATADGFSTNFKSTDNFGPVGLTNIFKEYMKDGVFAPSFYFFDEDPSVTAAMAKWDVSNMAYARIQEQFVDARLFVARLVENSLPVTGNLVDIIPSSTTAQLSTDYINWLLTKEANLILDRNDVSTFPSDSMLFLMLRQSLLQGYQEAALNILQREGVLAEVDRRSAGDSSHYHYKIIQDNQSKNKYLTKWHFLFKNLTDLVTDRALPQTVTANPFYNYISTGTSFFSLANYLDGVSALNPIVYNNTHLLHFNKLKNTRNALQTLERVSSAGLEILMAEHIDMCTYRLDSWLMGFVVKRLQQQRVNQPAGIFIGAYGYVENLKRDTNKRLYTQSNVATDFKLDATKPVYHDTNNQGFIHGPSISQAITAAVLRNAYMTNNEAEDVQNRLSVNISSARVRMALQLMEGIRNGQETGAVLGFQFERGLHDRYKLIELDKYIQPFRQAFPLQQKVDESANGEPVYISQVVNGSAIIDVVYAAVNWLDYNNSNKDKTIADLLKQNNYALLPAQVKTVIDTNLAGDNAALVYDSVIEEIDRMADAFDALGDLAISESVYQMVLGNHVRAAAVLTALSEGKNIPEPQVIDTIRTGTIVTQSVLINLQAVSSSAQIPAGWASLPTVRSAAEPSFNNWLGQALGAAASIKYVLTLIDQNKNITKISASIAALNLQPIDLFLLPGSQNELVDIIISQYRKSAPDYTSNIFIDPKEKDSSWSDTDKSVSEIFMLIKHIRNMISNAKPIGSADLAMPNNSTDSNNPGNWDAVQLQTRLNDTYKSLQTFVTNVAAETYVDPVLKGTQTITDIVLAQGDVDDIFTHLTEAVFLGIANALSIPFNVADTDAQRAATLLQQLINVYKEVLKRKTDADVLITAIAAITVIKLQVDKLAELAKILLGKNALVLPLYTPLDVTAIQTQLALVEGQKIYRNGDAVVVENWLQNVAKVRKRVYDISMYLQTSDAYDFNLVKVEPVQLPYVASDYWLGIDYPSSYTPSGDSLSLVLVNPAMLQTAGTQTGFIVDEWLEVIPAKEQTTGITFNYNQPNASPPQSLLLAVTPSITNQWEWDDLVYTIIDTVEMAKNRAVEPDHFDHSFLSQLLPGVFAEVVPPQFRNEDTNPLGVQVVMDFADVKPPNPS